MVCHNYSSLSWPMWRAASLPDLATRSFCCISLISDAQSQTIQDQSFSTSGNENPFPVNISVPTTAMAKLGGSMGGVTLERSKLDLSQKVQTVEPKLSNDGGGGGIGKIIHNGGGQLLDIISRFGFSHHLDSTDLPEGTRLCMSTLWKVPNLSSQKLLYSPLSICLFEDMLFVCIYVANASHTCYPLPGTVSSQNLKPTCLQSVILPLFIRWRGWRWWRPWRICIWRWWGWGWGILAIYGMTSIPSQEFCIRQIGWLATKKQMCKTWYFVWSWKWRTSDTFTANQPLLLDVQVWHYKPNALCLSAPASDRS